MPPGPLRITMLRKSSMPVRSVAAVMLIRVSAPLSRPGAACTLLARRAAATSPAVRPRAASRVGSSQTRMASDCAPPISTEATPGTAVTSGWATRVTKSVICGMVRLSLTKATY